MERGLELPLVFDTPRKDCKQFARAMRNQPRKGRGRTKKLFSQLARPERNWV